MSKKLWGGRFEKKSDDLMERFSSSLDFDCRLYETDIEAGIAHARVLREGGYLNGREEKEIVRALNEIREEIETGRLSLAADEHEDIHSVILARLIDKTGETGKKLHAGRSRNDLIVLDTRIYLLRELETISSAIETLQTALVKQGRCCQSVIIPGYTHLQHAQPVLFAHHLLAYVEMLERDKERLADARKRVDVLPSGSAALSGTGLKLDQKLMARLLGFSRVTANSLDAVSDRDFIAEPIAVLALIGMHLSRLGEELVLWSGREFGFIELDEAYCTGSSFLPRRRIPIRPS